MSEKEIKKELIIIYHEEGFSADIHTSSTNKTYCDQELYKSLLESPFKALYHLGFATPFPNMSPSLSFLQEIASMFVRTIASDSDIEITKKPRSLVSEQKEQLLNNTPFCIGAEYITEEWLDGVWSHLSYVFLDEIDDYQKNEYSSSITEYLRKQDPALQIVGKVFFHLVENKNDEEYPFAFLATYSTSDKDSKNAVHMPLNHALMEFKDNRELLLKLLAQVSKAADSSKLISDMVESGELFSPLRFTIQEAYQCLKEIHLYEECGIVCRVPDWWKKKYNTPKLSIQIGEKKPSKLGMDALVDFKPQLYFGDSTMTRDEIEQYLNEVEGLTLIKGKWVEIDHERLSMVLNAYEQAAQLSNQGEMTMAEAMRAQLTLQDDLRLPEQEDMLSISHGTWLKEVRNRLLHPAEIEMLSLGSDFKANLRSYQQVGVNWLGFMEQLSFGALLADDMGLGKTLQVLALLEYRRKHKKGGTLLIVPASLIGNWIKEIQRFAPKLNYKLLHTSSKDTLTIEKEKIGKDTPLYITTYGMVLKMEQLKEIQWELLILDEAQAIKNPNTKQTKGIKQISADARIAMTGTPIENRLSDLWSIFDFLNKGFLGSAKEFSKMVNGLEDYSKLRSSVGAFMLRRLKTDKSIISDLPDKVEVNAYATLTKKQLVLYRNLVQELEYSLNTTDGIQRKGIVLSGIMKFKQICNHPDQYLGKQEFDESSSGKFEKLRQLCEVIYEKRERVLIFTQFKEMTTPIAQFLETIFERKGLVLHGGVSAKKRTEMVELFQSQEYIPFMVLSLKAGGVGLNLTMANHVIHFDRWWNPAIENQATDRAFRIGQKKNVLVHKFITSGTIEEKIDDMIQEKQKLSQDIIVKSGENWITEMNTEELLSLFRI